MFKPELACIVSAYKQPEHLWICLASLRVQREIEKPWPNVPLEIVVTDDSHSKENKQVALHYGCKYVPTDYGCCYTAAEEGVRHTTAPFLCFPSHDNWYVPEFAARMLRQFRRTNPSLVYCDMLHDPRYTGKYEVIETLPIRHHCDKGGIVVKREVFNKVEGFTGKAKKKGERTVADGILVETVSKADYCERISEPLYYHG